MCDTVVETAPAILGYANRGWSDSWVPCAGQEVRKPSESERPITVWSGGILQPQFPHLQNALTTFYPLEV